MQKVFVLCLDIAQSKIFQRAVRKLFLDDPLKGFESGITEGNIQNRNLFDAVLGVAGIKDVTEILLREPVIYMQ